MAHGKYIHFTFDYFVHFSQFVPQSACSDPDHLVRWPSSVCSASWCDSK